MFLNKKVKSRTKGKFSDIYIFENALRKKQGYRQIWKIRAYQFVIVYKTFLTIREFSADETEMIYNKTIQVIKLQAYWLIKVASQNTYTSS